MKNTTVAQYDIDNASILFLAQIRKDHTNTFRFSMTLSEDICPQTLQMAVNRTYRRFPTVIAGFQRGFFHYNQVPVETPPKVQPDPGYLTTMSAEELCSCAYRVFYEGKKVSIEAFHALTDGYGAIASFTTLVAEYLRLKYNIQIPVSCTLADVSLSPSPDELEDAFLIYAQEEAKHLPSRYSYQLPGGNLGRDCVRNATLTLPTQKLLDAAHHYNVSVNTLLSTIMAVSVMEVQHRHSPKKTQPVRIMVPVNLRRMFPSRTVRNFSYYALPTLEPQDSSRPFSELLHSFAAQIKSQLEKDHLGAIISNNVKMQNSLCFRIIPLAVKIPLIRFVCKFFGETNSSVTVTNLGTVVLPEEMRPFVEHMDVSLTPRIRSPYGCAILSYKDKLTINVSRFPQESELDEIFYQKLNAVINAEDLDK